MRRVRRVDWVRVRDAMAMSIRGHGLSAEGDRIVEEAFAADPETYGRLHDEEKAKAVAELNPLARTR